MSPAHLAGGTNGAEISLGRAVQERRKDVEATLHDFAVSQYPCLLGIRTGTQASA